MATKKDVKMRDLKPSKDAKGGVALNKGNRNLAGSTRQGGTHGSTTRGPSTHGATTR